MKYIVDDEICKKYDLEVSQFLTILLLDTKTTFEQNIEKLLDAGILVKDTNIFGTKYYLTQNGITIITNILADSQQSNPNNFDERVDNLATKLMEIFPKGRKEGTNVFWRGNHKEIVAKLKMFLTKVSNKYTDEEIINATQRYVDYHTNSSSIGIMRVLKYFIIKNEIKNTEDGKHVEAVSDLLTYLENPDCTATHSDWTANIRSDE